MEQEVICPSGLAGKIRALKVKEEKLFSDAKILKSGRIISELLKFGWVETTDPGLYDFAKSGKIDWNRVLQGDATFLFMRVRGLTYGEDYEITVPCRSCRDPIDHVVNLAHDLSIQPLPEESQEAVRTNSPIETEFEGRRYAFRLLTLGDEKKISRLEESREMSGLNAALAVRLVAVEGVGGVPSHITGPTEERQVNPFELIRYVEDMPAGEADALREHLEEFDCGVDTDVTVTCDKCFYEQVFPLPLESNFFQRRQKKTVKRSKMKRAGSLNSLSSPERSG